VATVRETFCSCPWIPCEEHLRGRAWPDLS
jgi:hypothetical protein